VPLLLFLLLERQASRLDALAARGEPAEARVTAVSRDQAFTAYAYRVGGSEYTWDAARADAPFAVGQSFRIVFLPDDPSFSRPFTDRGLAAQEAERNRSFSLKACVGVALILLLCAGLTHRDLKRLRNGTTSEWNDPKAYKQRLRATGAVLIALVLAVSAFHFSDAQARGESVIPVVLTALIGAGILASVLYFGGRDGPLKASERSAKIIRWVVPVAIGLGVVRLIQFFAAR
jgi:hypothetical protein